MDQVPQYATEPKHRRDIDGLRAIAVIPVVLFHAGVPWMSGGFIGVDVFFVISGYLITNLILDDIRADRFSIVSFYERRVRRILPALFGVLAFSSVAAYLLFVPQALRDFGRSLVATVYFSSNILFWRESGYFDAPADSSPFLHTWSLAVEEQFYIFYPLFLYLIKRYMGGRYGFMICATLAASLVLSIWGVYSHPEAAFYLAPTRAWELLIGTVLALKLVPYTRNEILAGILGVAGLLFIGYAVVAYSSNTPFPGVNALLPVCGAALVIYSGASAASFVTKLLSLRPLVFVGLISYSLYLWHWVLLVFTKSYLVRPVTHSEIALVIAVSTIAAIASWRFIENPFRGRQGIGSRRWLFRSAAAVSVVLACFGVAALVTGGMPGRLAPEARLLLSNDADVWARRSKCANKVCRVGVPRVRPTFMLWGDSEAGALAPALERLAADNHIAGLIAQHAACAPLLTLRRYERGGPDCRAVNEAVLLRLRTAGIRNVYLHARWGLYAEGLRYKQEQGPPALLTKSRRVKDDYAEFGRLLRLTLARLHRRRLHVVIIASVPEVGVDVPAVVVRTAMSGSSIDFSPTFAEFMDRQFRTFKSMQEIANEYGVTVVYPHKLLCNTTHCTITGDGYPLYSDSVHLSVRGAMSLMPLLEQLLPKRATSAQ